MKLSNVVLVNLANMINLDNGIIVKFFQMYLSKMFDIKYSYIN